MISLRNLKKREGFTLIELMIVVAIIGILAAIAIPNFLKFQLRSKAGEGKVNLAAIRTAEEGYFAEFGTYIQNTASPAAAPTSAKAAWADVGVAPNNFDTIGWEPEGDVFFQYNCVAGPQGALAVGGVPNTYYTCEGRSDLDGDAAFNIWGYVHADPAGNAVAGVWACPNTGVWDPVTTGNTLLSVVGPCAAGMAQSIF